MTRDAAELTMDSSFGVASQTDWRRGCARAALAGQRDKYDACAGAAAAGGRAHLPFPSVAPERFGAAPGPSVDEGGAAILESRHQFTAPYAVDLHISSVGILRIKIQEAWDDRCNDGTALICACCRRCSASQGASGTGRCPGTRRSGTPELSSARDFCTSGG
jgi:hypothetical protein